MLRYLLYLSLFLASCSVLEKTPTTCDDTAPAFDADGSDVSATSDYLVNVFSTPADSQSPDAIVSFTMSTGESSSGLSNALSLKQSQRLSAITLDPEWIAKSRFEQARHAQLVQVMQQPVGIRRALLATSQPCDGACGLCGEVAMCWQCACVDEVMLSMDVSNNHIDTVLVGVVRNDSVVFNVLLDKAYDVPAIRSKVLDTATQYAEVFAGELRLLGQVDHSGAVDRDYDFRLTLVFTNATHGDITDDLVGFFDFHDFLPTAAGGTGNEADLLWARIPGTTNGTASYTADLIVGTLVHEYTHLSSYARRAYANSNADLREVYWLDEGLAHLMEDLNGYGPSSVQVLQAALTHWQNGGFAAQGRTPEQDIEMRGRAMLFLRHLIDSQVPSAASATDAVAMEAARNVVSTLVAEEKEGYEHAIFQCGGEDALWRFQIALYATGNSDVTFEPAHRFDFLPVSTSTVTGHKIGIDPRGDYVDARGNALTLEGPNITEFTGTPDTSALPTYISDSGSVFLHFTDFDARGVTMTPDDPAFTRLFVRRQRVQ
jgi:hypothetical protein